MPAYVSALAPKRPRQSGKSQRYKRLLHSIARRQGRIRVSARAAAWIQHTSCTHPIAGCRDTKPYCRQAKISGRRLYQAVCSTVSGVAKQYLGLALIGAARQKQCQTDNGKVSFPASQKSYQNKVSHGCCDYSTLGKSGHRAPHGSFILCAIFFGHSAVSSSSQSMSLASRPRFSMRRCSP